MANAITIVESWDTQHVAEVFLKPVFTSESIVDTYAVDPTVNRSKTIVLAEELKRIIKKKTGCGFDALGTFALGEKQINTQPCAINLEECAGAFYDTVFKQNLKRGSNIYDLGGTVIEKVMVDRVSAAINNDIFELCWFGDTGSSVDFFKTFDGWFKLLNSDASVTKKTISTTGELDPDEAIDLLRDIYKSAGPLRSVKPTEKVFLVTDSIYLNLMETFENKNTDSGLTRLTDGGPLSFRGIPVESQITWDATIADQNLGQPHRVVYTKKENLIIGTDLKKPGTDAKLFLDELTEKFLFKANFDLGVQFLFAEHVVYAR